MPGDSSNPSRNSSSEAAVNNTNSLAEPLLPPTTTTTPPSPPTDANVTTMSTPFLAAVLVAILPMFLFGFATGVMNAPAKIIFSGHSLESWSIAVSAFCVGGVMGANVSGKLADQYGRRPCLLVLTGYLSLVAGLVQVMAPNMGVLIIGRILIGIAGGASTVLTPMYLGEISPPQIRGSIGTLTQLSCVVGILASILVALPFLSSTDPDVWRWIFVPIPATAVVFLVCGQCLGLLPESPRWLLLYHADTRGREARATLFKFRIGTPETTVASTGSEDHFQDEPDEPTVEMEAVQDSLVPTNNSTIRQRRQDDSSANNSGDEYDDEQHELPAPMSFATANTSDPNLLTETTSAVTSTSFRDFALDPKNRIPLASSILFPVVQQLSGINAVFYYSTSFFEGVIANPQTGTIIAFTINLFATILAVMVMDKYGRKTLLTWSAGGMFACCILLTMALKGILPKMASVVCVMLYISFFEMGLGCIPFFIASEMIAPQHLGTVQSLSMSMNWFSNFCVGMAFPYMDKYLGAYSFVPFACVLLGAVMYAIFVLPETQGRSLEEIMQELEEKRARRGGHQALPSQDPVDQQPEILAV